MKKKVLSLLVISMLFCINVLNVNAKEKTVQNNNNEIGLIIPEDYPRTRATFYGPAGSLKINYMSSARAISWSVNCPMAVTFMGTLSVTESGSGKKQTYTIYKQMSGVIDIKVTRGKVYTASLNGGAEDGLGKLIAVTVPNSISFTA